MKVEILIGSPRKNGNTFVLSNHLNELLNNKDVHSYLTFLYDYDIKPCIDCRACKKGKMKCSVIDEAHLLFESIENADVLVIATPIYWFSPTAKTKLLIDRLRPYYVNKRLKDKKGAIILPAGSGTSDCDLTIEMFRRIFTSLEIEFLDAVAVEAYDVGDAMKDESNFDKILMLSEKIIGK